MRLSGRAARGGVRGGGALQAEKNKEPWEPPWEIGGRREERAQLPGGGRAGVGEASG